MDMITHEEVQSATGSEIGMMLDALTEEQKTNMLIFLAGYNSLAFTASYNLEVSVATI